MNAAFEWLPPEIKQNAREARQNGKVALRYGYRRPLREVYHIYPILPKLTELHLSGPFLEKGNLWVCAECEYATTSALTMMVHTVRDIVRIKLNSDTKGEINKQGN